ncbi:MAG: hypothetical protein AAF351_12925 [Pseudomonadota bacterium]
MATLRKLFVLTAFLGLSGLAGADTLDMQGTQVDTSYERPSRGMTQARVEERYGIPEARNAAVGNPPISSWEYSTFVVYFEYDRVIHSVNKR